MASAIIVARWLIGLFKVGLRSPRGLLIFPRERRSEIIYKYGFRCGTTQRGTTGGVKFHEP